MNDILIPSQREREPKVKVAFKPIFWLKKIDFVKRLVLDNNVLISLLGDEESGKTTFGNLLRSLPSSQIHPYMLMANPRFNRDVILKEITHLMKIDGESTIEEVVENCKRQKSHHLLIIDDAHYLSIDFIEEILSELKAQGNKAYFHVMLISNFSLVTALNTFAEEAYKDMIHSIEVPPLTESETKTYVLQHMPFLMGPGRKINDERFKQFFQITQGHLVEINREMGKFFYDAASHPIQKKRSMIYPFSIAIVIGLVSIASFFLWDVAKVYFIITPQELIKTVTPTPSITPLDPIVQKTPILNSQIPNYTVFAKKQSLTTLVRMNDLVDDDEQALNQPTALLDKVIVAPKEIVKKSSIPAIKDQASNVNEAKNKSQKVIMKKNNYTVQLLASRNRNKLTQFVRQHHLNHKTQIIRTVHQGNDWYILIEGEYSAHQLAKQAINALPKDIAQFKPWVRRVSDLKDRAIV